MVITQVADHPVLLRGADVNHASVGPVLLERTDQDFLAAVLAELAAESGIPSLGDSRLAHNRDADKVLKLQQPVHRTFYVALLDIACDMFGQSDVDAYHPPLDPQRIDSAGLVVRRLSNNGREAWCKDGKTIQGWVPFLTPLDEDLDPDPRRRPQRNSAGHPEIDRQLALIFKPGTSTETVSTLFVAPPDVFAATGRTILYGLVPLTSSEQSDRPAILPPFDAAAQSEIRADMPRLFQHSGPNLILPYPGRTLSPSDAATLRGMDNFVSMLQQIAIEYGAFGTTSAAQLLFAELNTLTIDYGNDKKVGAASFLRDATRVLVQGDPAVTVQMPPADAWPAVDQDRENRIFNRVIDAIRAQLDVVSPHEGRFEDLTRQYVIRAFVRVKDDDDCPPRVVWSHYSEGFRIAPWYDPGNAPPIKIVLPDATDKNFLKNVKPNVSFVVPSDLFAKLRSPADKWLKGAPDGGGIGLSWICSFSIPIITLVAFIVLYIFLTLFNLIFQWLFWVKICIPFPVRKPRP